MPASLLSRLALVAAFAGVVAIAAAKAPAPYQNPDASTVHTVHVVFTHHLDVGLNEGVRYAAFCAGFATKIIQEYFDVFIPRAIRVAQELSDDDENRFAYTIHPWIASLYVDCVPWEIPDGCPRNPGKLICPTEAQVAAFDAAVRRGDLLWADSPFNVNPSVVGEPGMFEALMGVASDLNERYGLNKSARVWSNVDVPGFSRSSVPLLKRAGASALSICANIGSPSQGGENKHIAFAGVQNATMFVWHDPVSEEEILVLYHAAQRDNMFEIPLWSEFNTYAGFTRPDNMIITPGGTALASFVAADNTGPPPTTHEVKSVFKRIRGIFPNAKTVFSSTWDKFVADITPEETAALPRFSSEWGDDWLTGMSSDPARLATYRATIRARAACVASGACDVRDKVLRNFTRFAGKNSEHTQGIQGAGGQPGSQLCIWLAMVNLPCPGDSHYKNADFNAMHNADHNIFPGADDSWLEARVFNTLAVAAVPPEHPMAAYLRDELAALEPTSPASLPPFSSTLPPNVTCTRGGKSATLRFSPSSGSLESLAFGQESSPWSQLMDLRYVTTSDGGNGVTCNDTKCPNPVTGASAPSLLGMWTGNDSETTCRVVLQLGFNDTLHTKYGAPATVTAEYIIDPARKAVSATLTCRNKTATRIPEWTSVFFRPEQRAGYRWQMDKLGEWVSPAEVAAGGQQYMHGVWSGIRFTSDDEPGHGLSIRTLDAAMACPVLNHVADATLTPESAVEKACFKYKIPGPDGHRQQQLTDAMIDGLGVTLHTNIFGISGFPQWYPFGVSDRYQAEDETMQFRFVIEEL